MVANELKKCLDALWDDLPLDTVSATILDPRFKFYDKIPKNETREALERLREVYLILHLFILTNIGVCFKLQRRREAHSRNGKGAR